MNKRIKLTAERRAGLLATVAGLAGPVCATDGLELVHVEYLRETDGRKLRLYIDKPGGVGLDDCIRVTRSLSDLLDVELEEDYGPYNLEVSSPGVDRPLVKPADFQRFQGKTAKIRTSRAIDGQKNFTGTLKGTTPGTALLESDGRTIEIPFAEIARARLFNYNGEN